MSNHLATLKANNREFVLQDFSRPVWTEAGTESRFIPNPETWLSEAITIFGLSGIPIELILFDARIEEFSELPQFDGQISVRPAGPEDQNLTVTPFS